ncbi:MAG: hypothetical protein V4655_09820 [Bdellovibrionota bacterium]|nr:MAG: hypothetical protein EOP10_15375 [Pseudomonadota bacterium]
MNANRLLTLCLLALSSFSCHASKVLSAKSWDGRGPKYSVTISTTAKSIADLPECNGNVAQMEAYVSGGDSFVKCDGYRWRLVNPGGFDGRYQARGPIRFHEWEDSSSNKRWSIPIERPIASSDAEKSCSSGYKLPSADELKEAFNNGLVEGIRAHGGRRFDRAWTSDFIESGAEKERVSLPLTNQPTEPTAHAAGVYCVSFASHT